MHIISTWEILESEKGLRLYTNIRINGRQSLHVGHLFWGMAANLVGGRQCCNPDPDCWLRHGNFFALSKKIQILPILQNIPTYIGPGNNLRNIKINQFWHIWPYSCWATSRRGECGGKPVRPLDDVLALMREMPHICRAMCCDKRNTAYTCDNSNATQPPAMGPSPASSSGWMCSTYRQF